MHAHIFYEIHEFLLMPYVINSFHTNRIIIAF